MYLTISWQFNLGARVDFVVRSRLRHSAGALSCAGLREFIRQEAEAISAESQNLQNLIPSQIQMSEADLAVFHSSWMFSTVCLLTAFGNFQTLSEIGEKLDLPPEKIEATMSFLLSCGLCLREGQRFKPGPGRTHLPDSSPFHFIAPNELAVRGLGAHAEGFSG